MRKWSAAKTVTEAQRQLRRRDNVGSVAVGRKTELRRFKGMQSEEGEHTRETKHGLRRNQD